ncbi:MAG: ferritin-like domain-containing protein [Acetobacteraceae bacterium]
MPDVIRRPSIDLRWSHAAKHLGSGPSGPPSLFTRQPEWENLMKSLDELFMHFLQDVYYAERQLLKALPKMAKNAQEPALKAAFTVHREETVHQVERLEQVFEHLGKRAKGVPCEAIKGLIEEADEVLEESDVGAVRDAGLAACGQAVEHYEIARYGALIAWAQAGGHKEIVGLLQQTLDEEKKADKLLNDLATKHINKSAAALAKAT